MHDANADFCVRLSFAFRVQGHGSFCYARSYPRSGWLAEASCWLVILVLSLAFALLSTCLSRAQPHQKISVCFSLSSNPGLLTCGLNSTMHTLDPLASIIGCVLHSLSCLRLAPAPGLPYRAATFHIYPWLLHFRSLFCHVLQMRCGTVTIKTCNW
ncbi:hypothetical protein HDV64DRAFT_65010 [Trichoderma sp. TUCIM 5745]